MNTQSNRTVCRLASGEAMHLGRLGGELSVVEGRIWLTRNGDLGDHVVEAGQRVRLGVDENAVIESATTGRDVTVRWYPRRQSVAGALLVAPLRVLAYVAELAARGSVALARSASDGVCRAQGSIKGGDAAGVSVALK